MGIKKIAHIGIAVNDLDAQVAHYRDVLGLTLLGFEEVADQKIRAAIFEVGESHIELLAPTADDSPVAKFLARRGEGIHHLAFGVEGIEGMLRSMEERDVRLIDKQPRAGAHGLRIAFLHPTSTFGVLTELCE